MRKVRLQRRSTLIPARTDGSLTIECTTYYVVTSQGYIRVASLQMSYGDPDFSQGRDFHACDS